MATKRTTEKAIAEIARAHLAIETLETRQSDALDFHDVAVWNVRAALEAAYDAGVAAASVAAANRTTDQKINALIPGASVVLTRVYNTRVVAERSGDGKRLRIVREYLDANDENRVLGFDTVLNQVW